MEPPQPSPSPSSQPEYYAQKVFNYSKLDARSVYLSGTHYARLGKFLTLPYLPFSKDCTIDIPTDRFEFVTVCDLIKKRDDPDRTLHFSRPEDFQNFFDSYSPRQNVSLLQPLVRTDTHNTSITSVTGPTQSQVENNGCLVFLRGFASALWLNTLGSCLDIDPEFLFRHMDAPKGPAFNISRPDRVYSTPFPSSRDLIRLRVCNSGSWDISKHGTVLNALRKSCDDAMRDHINKCSTFSLHETGESVIRRFILHNLCNFSIEQHISIEVIYHTRRWFIVVWLDCGKALSHGSTGPFSKSSSPATVIDLHPVFQHRSRMALAPRPERLSSVFSDNRPCEQQMFQSIDHLRQNYGSYLKTELMAEDAFYALNELFQFSAASIDQLLELFDDNIRSTSYDSTWLNDSTRLSETLLIKALVDDYRSYIADTLELVISQGGSKWPRVVEVRKRQKADRAASLLRSRYESLLKRCERLSDHCTGLISILQNAETQRQTERTIEQTHRLSKLTMLAYIYIPLTFASGFFGMNFKEIGTHLSIWVYFVSAVPLLIVSIAAWSFDIQEGIEKIWKLLHLARDV